MWKGSRQKQYWSAWVFLSWRNRNCSLYYAQRKYKNKGSIEPVKRCFEGYTGFKTYKYQFFTCMASALQVCMLIFKFNRFRQGAVIFTCWQRLRQILDISTHTSTTLNRSDCCISCLQISTQSLDAFLLRLEQGYSKHSNPYHNLLHAADVTQTTYHLISNSGLVVSLQSLYTTSSWCISSLAGGARWEFVMHVETLAFVDEGQMRCVCQSERAERRLKCHLFTCLTMSNRW